MSHKILIVEDETFIANLYKEEMERHDVQVTIATNGQEAVEWLGKEHFHLVLLDLIMPLMDGYGVLEYMRKHTHDVPAVVVTNLIQDMTTEKCHSLGAVECIFKSDVDAEDVWEKVKKYLR